MGLKRLFRRRKSESPPTPSTTSRRTPTPKWATSERLQRFARDHDDVDGWFATPDLLVWDAFLEFQEREGIAGPMLEIGVFKGRSALFSSLFAGANDRCWFLDVIMDPDFRSVLEARMPENAHFLEVSSFEVGEDPDAHFRGMRDFRWIHIDGQHTASAVVNDLEIADRLLAPRGLVSMDDFLSPTWPHVAAGVFRYLHENPGRLELVLTAYNKGYLARPDAVAYYQRFLRDDVQAHFASRNFDDFTMIECMLHDADDGIHCFGMGHRYGGMKFLVNDNRIDRPRPSAE